MPLVTRRWNTRKIATMGNLGITDHISPINPPPYSRVLRGYYSVRLGGLLLRQSSGTRKSVKQTGAAA
jgi:hypothetical protein